MGLELGHRLIQANVISRLQFAQVLEEGPIHSGGWLIKRLVERGMDENRLVEFLLAEGHGPIFSPDALESADPVWVHQLDAKTASSLLALAVGVEGPDGVSVAMADPTDSHALRDLQRQLGRRVYPRVAFINDLARALTRWYPANQNIELHRYVSLEPEPDDEGFTHRGLGHPPRSPLPNVPGPSVVTRSPIVFQAEVTGSYDLRKLMGKKKSRRPRTDSWDAEPVVQQPTLSAPAPAFTSSYSRMLESAFTSPEDQFAPKATSLAEVLAYLRRCKKADDVAATICKAACAVARAAVVMRLRQGILQGWYSYGPDVDEERVRALRFAVESSQIFRGVIESGVHYVGTPGDGETDKALQSILGSEGGLLIIEPLVIRRRLIGLFCADGVLYGEIGKHRMHLLARAASEAFERLIGQRLRRIRITRREQK